MDVGRIVLLASLYRVVKNLKIMNVKIDRVNERKNNLIKDYSQMGFNWHCIMRLRSFKNYSSYIRQPYNSKMSFSYVDRVMDRLAKRYNIKYVAGFVEQDDYLANHLHFTWSSPDELTREKLARTMRINRRYLRDIFPLTDQEQTLSYFTKRLYSSGSYNNIYSYN